MDLHDNCITHMPSALGRLHGLRTLNLAENAISRLDVSVCDMSHLDKLELRGKGRARQAHLQYHALFDDAPDGDHSPVPVTPSLATALALCGVVTLAFGVAPQLVARFTDVSLLALGG